MQHVEEDDPASCSTLNSQGFRKVLKKTPDTDVFIIAISCISPITSELFI